MTLLSIGDAVQPGSYRVHSRFNRVLNFTGRAGLVSVVSEEIGAGPVNVVVRGIDLQRLARLDIDAASVQLGGRAFNRAEATLYGSRLETRHADPVRYRVGLDVFERNLRREAPARSLVFLLDRDRPSGFRPGFESAVANHLAQGVTMAMEGECIAGVKMLKGCGFGLTPSGDDFIAGMLTALNVHRQAFGAPTRTLVDTVYEAARSENPFTDNLLRLAREGRLTERMKYLVEAVLGGVHGQIANCTRALLEIGATSGADWGVGFLLTARMCVRSMFKERPSQSQRGTGILACPEPAEGPVRRMPAVEFPSGDRLEACPTLTVPGTTHWIARQTQESLPCS